MPMRPYVSWTFADEEGEKSVVEIGIPEFGAGTFAVNNAAINFLKDALLKISGATITHHKQCLYNTSYSAAPPTDDNFLRGRKWQIHYQSVTDFRKYHIEVPVARVRTVSAQNIKDNRGFGILSHSNWTTFIDDFEQVARTPYGHDVQVLKAILVHRKS